MINTKLNTAMKTFYSILLVILLFSCTKDTTNQTSNGTYPITLVKYKNVVIPVKMFTSSGEITDTQTLNKYVVDNKTIDYINSDSSHLNYNKIVFLDNDSVQLVSPSGYKYGLRYTNNTNDLFKFYYSTSVYDSTYIKSTVRKIFAFDTTNVIVNGILKTYIVDGIGRGNYQNLNIPITWLKYKNINGSSSYLMANNEYSNNYTSTLGGTQSVVVWQITNSFK